MNQELSLMGLCTAMDMHVYMIPQKFYLIPKTPIDTPGGLLIPHPVVLFPQGPVAPAILIQNR